MRQNYILELKGKLSEREDIMKTFIKKCCGKRGAALVAAITMLLSGVYTVPFFDAAAEVEPNLDLDTISTVFDCSAGQANTDFIHSLGTTSFISNGANTDVVGAATGISLKEEKSATVIVKVDKILDFKFLFANRVGGSVFAYGLETPEDDGELIPLTKHASDTCGTVYKHDWYRPISRGSNLYDYKYIRLEMKQDQDWSMLILKAQFFHLNEGAALSDYDNLEPLRDDLHQGLPDLDATMKQTDYNISWHNSSAEHSSQGLSYIPNGRNSTLLGANYGLSLCENSSGNIIYRTSGLLDFKLLYTARGNVSVKAYAMKSLNDPGTLIELLKYQKNPLLPNIISIG